MSTYGGILHDKDIREPLFDFLEDTFEKVRIIEEKPMGRSRADLMMVVPSAVIGIEIKSDADTYARLKRQVRDYDSFFDRNYVVAGVSHAMHIEEHVPRWWGIITAEMEDGRIDFYMLRRAQDNPKRNRKKKLGLLWRPELAHIQERCGLPAYRRESKEFVTEKLLEKLPPEILDEQISEELFERDYQAAEQEIREYRKSCGKSAGRIYRGRRADRCRKTAGNG